MRNIFLIAAIAFVCSNVRAHNPLTAKFELNAVSENGAILHVHLSQTGLHQALTKHYTKVDFKTIETTDYKELAVQYLKKHLTIVADETPLIIGEGGIKLGSHQTDFRFLVKNYPRNIEVLTVDINAFKENENHHSVFWWTTKEAKRKVVLSPKNNYKSSFGTGEVLENSTNVLTSGMSWGSVALLLSATFLTVIFSFQKKKLIPIKTK